MCRIGGKLGSMVVRLCGAIGEIPPLVCEVSNVAGEAWERTMSGGRFDWGGHLLKGNGGAQRSPRAGWKSACECKGKRGPDCETDGSSRSESWS